MDVQTLKQAATGRWPEVLAFVGGVPVEHLDGKNHPCPKCGGKDRFRLIDAEAGALFCNQCFSQRNGDGIAAMQWLTGLSFIDTVKQLSSYLHVGRSSRNHRDSTIVEAYDYVDESGELLYQVVRMEPKDFRQRRPKPGGGWEWTLKGTRLVPYRLPQLLAADPNKHVYIVEGEKDVRRLENLLLTATTNAGGAGKWKESFGEYFAGRPVVILPDNDEPGRAHAAKVAAMLNGKAVSIKVVQLPNLPDKGDVSNWLDAGGKLTDLERMVAEAEEWQESPKAVVVGHDSFALTDTGNAERFAKQHADSVRFCHAWQSWLVWDGKRWKRDDCGMVEQLGKQTVRSILLEAADEPNDDRRKALVSFAAKSEAVSRREAMLKLARSEPPLPITPEVLDTNNWTLNCLNGSIDLRSGQWRTHRREDFITRLCPVEYDAGAECPVWLASLSTWFQGNLELIEFVRRFIGYCLTGDISEQILAIWHGVGANGKSTILNVLMEMLGPDYAMKAAADLLLMKHGNDHPTALTDLHGKRFVACIETDDGRRLAESMVKELTGGDAIRARRMREDFWQFSPTHKLVLACNHRPVVRGTDNGIWRRIKLIPFNVVIPARDRDRHLNEKLRSELPGILAWSVRGCIDWRLNGLGEPQVVTEATGDYQLAEDSLANFIAECCILEDWARVRASDLLDAFREWSGTKSITTRKLTAMLIERGIQKHRNNGLWYVGIGLPAGTD